MSWATRPDTREKQQSTTSDVVDLLSIASAYPESTTSVERIETHISWVFLTDRYTDRPCLSMLDDIGQ